ncbi:retinoic acid-induced protein 3-like [Protopterus annectens]|uniref:retinoic acid-induced protein 3-like n=1 Tax=Protopterus annectens TaxID=7888 RepID=UPI001CF95653|nr:retinoic acid-induced protein 3-like [Protopterus annectens]
MFPVLLSIVLAILSMVVPSTAQGSPPRGCGSGLLSRYFYLCDLDSAWGIVLETIATAGVVATLALMIVLLVLIPWVPDQRKRSHIGIQFVFLLGTLGIFGLTFAFIITNNEQTCPTRIFLWGVLFALCFSCLLAHVWRLIRLVRTGNGPSAWCMLAGVVCLTLVQVIIAIEWLIITLVTNSYTCTSAYTQNDFVMILIYVLFLMAVTSLLSLLTFFGKHKAWKKHGAHIFVTMLFSDAIWIVWIVMLVKGNSQLGHRPIWDDPVLSIALVSNGWVFILMYIIPEMCYITRREDLTEIIDDGQPVRTNMYKTGVDNRVFSPDEPGQVNHMNVKPSAPPKYDNTIPMKPYQSEKEFTIPRPHTLVNGSSHPYEGYYGRQSGGL